MKVYAVCKGWDYEGTAIWAIFDTLAKAEHEKHLLGEENKNSRYPSSNFYVEVEEFDLL